MAMAAHALPVGFLQCVPKLSQLSSAFSVSSSLWRSQLRALQLKNIRSTHRRRTVSTRCEAGASEEDKPSFGYTRKDVLLIGLGVTAFGVGLKYALEIFGLDSLKAGNVVQLVMVLGLTIGWIFSYLYRVSNKDMTYTKQLKDYEMKVMERRYQELPEAEVEALLAQVEEEKEQRRKRLEQKQQNN